MLLQVIVSKLYSVGAISSSHPLYNKPTDTKYYKLIWFIWWLWERSLLLVFNIIEIGLNVKNERKLVENKKNKNKFPQFPETRSGMHMLREGQNETFPGGHTTQYDVQINL